MAQEKKPAQKTRGKPDAVDVHVGSRVRERRVLHGWSQKTLAGMLDLTFQQVQKYERGANRISAGRLDRLARALEVPITYFFEGLDVEAPAPQENLAASKNQREALLLVRAYNAIPDPVVRRCVLDLMQSLGEQSADDED